MDIGARLRMVRENMNLSQRELAKRAGVTNGTISLIEQNRVSPSISSLKKVLEGLPMTLADFFTFDAEPKQPTVFYQAGELPNLGNEEIELLLVGTAHERRDLAILKERYLPGADTGPDMLEHEGQEGGVVISGEVELTVGSEVRTLGPGDAYYFDSRLPHRFRNLGDAPCEIVSASSPPTF
ncbi:cupin domain-containing protein [Crenobacter intestini]|uniref:Cupin domain-containing protein n=1 Tax=Crenobacter intestini TaxID=2563443 RepID=A0A4T0UWE3_9NEIS|nr:cupin domain-containing protein [Crenobacter intestini]TIC83096.1 cupin domain-containing protein [Crenobacter intestini]